MVACEAAFRGGGAAPVEGVVRGITHPLHHALEHGYIDPAAAARFQPGHECRQNVGIGIHSGGDVRDGTGRLAGLLARSGRRQES